ncbi:MULTISPECIES: YopX family protein [Muribaculaceae]|uniref:YopX family protein n=1 Tax=Muribaculaceae TaxID=2005473 RepID=UPI0026480054|nr:MULTISPECIES: YopX family protein [Muribaculaceae]
MKTIKFRAKTTANGHWVYGSLINHGNGLFSISNRKSNTWVQEDSIGQFTGLPDRNGKEIYQGDIITVNGRYPRVVLWDKVSWAIIPCELYNDKHFWVMNLQHPGNDWWEEFADEIEVVGNMYDNPELLNGKQSKS